MELLDKRDVLGRQGRHPSIGFGPGDEVTAHTTIDLVSLKDVVDATEFYALWITLATGEYYPDILMEMAQ